MSTNFTHPARRIISFICAVAAAFVAFLLSGIALREINPFRDEPDPAFFRLLIGSSMVVGPSILFFLGNTRYHGLRLLGLTLAVYVGAAHITAYFETVAFRSALGFGLREILYLVIMQTLDALILVPLIITVAGKWKTPARIPEWAIGAWLPPPASFWIRTAILASLWYCCYIIAGFFIADPVTHSFYAARMARFEMGTINAWLFPLQLFRGGLWVLLFVLAVRVMNRPLAEVGLIAGLLFGVFHAAGLLLPNGYMPIEVRLSHLPEIILSLVMMGCLTVGTMGWRRAK